MVHHPLRRRLARQHTEVVRLRTRATRTTALLRSAVHRQVAVSAPRRVEDTAVADIAAAEATHEADSFIEKKSVE